MVTGVEIEEGLRQIGIRRNEILEVHSSLSSLGVVEGGAATVVDALMSAVSEEGTLAMSAYPLSKPLHLTQAEKEKGINAKVQLYRLDYRGKSGMGAIADEFRRRPGTVLGPGFHRVCAWGRDADLISEGYHRLLEKDGRVLLLGVGIGTCSCMHQAEKVDLPEEISAYFKVPEEIRREYPEDIYINYGSTPEDAWENVCKEAERRGLITRSRIGLAECMLFRAQPMVAIYEHALRTDPFGLYGLNKVNP
jgi:aminoglycoside 3-N-acetyltransferase